jgi:NAD(P)-dependent dehydrogenase (short-subunit alcohol dehydrogenase family)
MELDGRAGCVGRFIGALPSLGRIDILAVALGPFLRASLAETGAADWERLALLDLALPGALASALLPAMAARGWGRILLFGGTRTDGIRAYSSNAAYAAAKTGLGVLAKSLAVEGAPAGVGCVLVCPASSIPNTSGRPSAPPCAPARRAAASFRPGMWRRPPSNLLAADPCVASGSVVTLDGGLSFPAYS